MSNCFSIQYPLIEDSALENSFEYKELPVAPELSDFICCFWSFYSYNIDIPSNVTLIPDPCINIVIDLNNLSNIYILGPMDKPIKYEIPQSSNFFGMRFLPGRFPIFSPFPVNDILNKILPFDDRFYEMDKLSINVLENFDVNGIQNFACEQLLGTKKYYISKASNINILASIEYMYQNKGNIHISDLAHMNYCSIRTLSRKYNETVGINPKLMCRIIRLQYTLLNYLNSSHSNITDIALNSGYYDQSHFTKDFKEFIGISPSLCKAASKK